MQQAEKMFQFIIWFRRQVFVIRYQEKKKKLKDMKLIILEQGTCIRLVTEESQCLFQSYLIHKWEVS